MSSVERNDESVVDRAIDWVLFDGSRWAVAGGSLLPIVVLLGLMAATDLLVLDDTEPLLFLFSAIVVGLLPLAVLFAYVLRVATVSQETIAITPFTMVQQESEDGSNGSEDGHPDS